MAQKIKNAIQKMGECIAKAWNASKSYIAGGMFVLTVATAIISIIIFIATGSYDEYGVLRGYALVGSCFCPLLAVPLGLLWHMTVEEI